MNNEVMKSDNHEPDYRTAMLYHSDRADAYMAERDAALSEVSRLRDRLARMEAAADNAIANLRIGKSGAQIMQALLVLERARAALTDGGSNG